MGKEGELISWKRPDAGGDLSERKARLLREGEFYRAGIVQAKANIKQGVRPENIIHHAIDHATWALRERMDGLFKPTGINIGTVMPYAMSILGFINRRRLYKPALGVAALMAVAAWYAHRQRSRLAQM